jgi:hypothetical protein
MRGATTKGSPLFYFNPNPEGALSIFTEIAFRKKISDFFKDRFRYFHMSALRGCGVFRGFARFFLLCPIIGTEHGSYY